MLLSENVLPFRGRVDQFSEIWEESPIFDIKLVKMSYNLCDYLKQLKDSRRKEGLRHPLWAVIAMIIMAIISGQQGLKGFARFMKANDQELTKAFELKHGVPSFGTIRTILLQLDLEELQKMFIRWMRPYFRDEKRAHLDALWLSLDGKGLSSTVQNAHNPLQDFVMMVSLFAQNSGLTMAIEPFHNKKSSESQVVRDLIQKLGLKDVIFTLDAAHCQKKH